MKKLRGTALYCGIGTDINTMEKHLKEASEAGINAMFTSLQLPEADVAQTLRDFPKMAEIAHRYGILVDADIATRTATRFGIDMFDVSAIKALGIDIARYDGGLARERHRGDITIASSRMWRYSGEVQIARMDLPFDPDMRIVARVIDEDLPLLDTFHLGPRRPFRFIKAN